jgi:hypothetical protein
MASPARIREAIIEIFTKLDKEAKTPVRDPGIQTPDWAAMEKAQEAVPKSIQAKQDINQLNLERATDKALAGQTEVRGSGPAALTSASGTKFKPLEETVRDKGFITELEEEFDKLGRAGTDPRSLSEEAATKIVESRRAAKGPKKDKNIAQREQRRKQIREGTKFPKESKKDFGESPLAFGESEFGTPGEVTSLIDEATGPTRSVNKGIIKNKFGSIEQEGAKETMENLFTAEDARRAGEIQDELALDNVLQTLSPELQKQVAEEILIPKSIRYKRIDELGKVLLGGKGDPGKVPEIQAALGGRDISRDQAFGSLVGTRQVTTPPPRSKADIQQVKQSSKQFNEFRKLVSQVLAAGREANKMKPDMAKVAETIERMPKKVQNQLDNMVESGLELDEALAEYVEQLVRRTEQ